MPDAEGTDSVGTDTAAATSDRAATGRRQFLSTMTAAGAVVSLGGACVAGEGRDAEAPSSADAGAAPPYRKDPSPFIQHPTNLETRLEDLQGIITPVDRFFVRNHAPTVVLDPLAYRLRIDGDGVAAPVEITLADLQALPARSVIAYLECAGNWRSYFATVLGTPAQGGQWGRGGVGCAEWTGASLRDVLALANVAAEAVEVNLHGLDDGGFNRPLPIDKALDPDTLVVWAMNGEPLHEDHGAPVRAIVPGWVGSNSVKWLGRIEVATTRQWVRNTTTSYVLIGDDWPADEYAPAEGAPITTQTIKSALALPWPAALQPGRRRMRGFAYSPHGPVTGVEWQVDDGGWRVATVSEPLSRWAWTRFEFEWDAEPGDYVVRTRAVDAAGHRQPESVPYNEKGYLLNVPLPHPVTVA